MSLVSIAGCLSAPLLRSHLGYKTLILVSAALHAALYGGMILLNQFAIIMGAAVTGSRLVTRFPIL